VIGKTAPQYTGMVWYLMAEVEMDFSFPHLNKAGDCSHVSMSGDRFRRESQPIISVRRNQ